MEWILYAIVGVLIGGIAGFLAGKGKAGAKQEEIQKELDARRAELEKEISEKAEAIKKERMLEAKEKFLSLKSEHEKEVNKRNQTILQAEQKAKQREKDLARQMEDLRKKALEVDEEKEKFAQLKEALRFKHDELDKLHQSANVQLEKIAGMTTEEAKAQLMENLREEAESRAKSILKETIDNAKLTAAREAKKIVLQTVQRAPTEQAIENAISIFNIENDEVKGRIIGREGRNIRALEAATGVEIIVDDTPEAIVLSAFDSVRREIARLALHRLVSDGRIHPARIEEVVEKTRKQIEEEIAEIGERTCIDLGIHGLHPELVKLVGKMRYRSSYGQNLLQHSREVANFCAIMAAEMGLNAKQAKRAGLLHDIGKVSDEDPELPHALLGAKLAEKYKEHPAVVNAIGAHHDEIEMTDAISPIIQICDAISGARPGARREVFESYIKRLKDLENIAMSYEGVSKSYAIQAGRELRVIVESEKVSDEVADNLAFDIGNRIQTEMTYPGQIKITVIREKRAVAYAK